MVIEVVSGKKRGEVGGDGGDHVFSFNEYVMSKFRRL